MKDLQVAWQSDGALHLHGYVDIGDGAQTWLTVNRWHALGGSAVVQLSRIEREGDERVVPLPFTLRKLKGKQAQINGIPCGGRLLRIRIAVTPGKVDAWVLQTHIDVVTADKLFTAAGQSAWAQVVSEEESA